MSEGARVVQVVAGCTPEDAFESLVSRLEKADQYEVRDVGETVFGERRVSIRRAGLRYSVVVFEGGDQYPAGTVVRTTVPSNSFAETAAVDSDPQLRAVVSTARDVYEAIDGETRAAYGLERHQPMIAPLSRDDLPPSDRPFLTWLDVFPPEEVETVGRDTLLSAPAPRVEALADGSVLVASKNPESIDPDPLEAVADHVGIPSWEDRPHERASASDFEE